MPNTSLKPCRATGYDTKAHAKRAAISAGLSVDFMRVYESNGAWFYDIPLTSAKSTKVTKSTKPAPANVVAVVAILERSEDVATTADELHALVTCLLTTQADAVGVTGVKKLGKKDTLIVALARRACGVSGREIALVTGWPTASAKWECERIAKVRNWFVEPVSGSTEVRYCIDPTHFVM